MASYPQLPVKIPTAIPNLYLRTPRPIQHDATGLSTIFGHRFNNRFEPERPGSRKPTPEMYLEKIPVWLDMAEKGQNCFCLVALASEDASGEDEVIGFGGINALESKPAPQGESTHRIADIGVMLHEPYVGKGYGIAAFRATIDACFDLFAADVVKAETFFINEPFRGLMKKLRLDQFSTIISEEGPGEVLYYFTKAEWESVK